MDEIPKSIGISEILLELIEKVKKKLENESAFSLNG
jgi:hypothetical protein